MPYRGRSPIRIWVQDPNSAREATIRSPWRVQASSALNTAAMPVAVAQAAGAPSSAATRSCSIDTVGLDTRL